MPINDQIPLSAGPAGAARIDQSIPMNVASATPLQVTPFKAIDTMAATSDAYKLADNIEQFQANQSESLDQQKVKEEKQRDKMLLQQYQQSGGDLYTAGGLELAAKELSSKLSPDSLDGLSKKISEKKLQEVKMQSSLSKLDDDALDAVAKQTEASSKILNRAVSVYDDALKETKDPAKAQEVFEASKQALLQAASDTKDPATGRPVYSPQTLQQFSKMGPDQIRNVINDTKWHSDKMKEEQVARVRAAQVDDLESKIDKRDADIELNKKKLEAVQAKAAASKGEPLDDGSLNTAAEIARVSGIQTLTRFSKEQKTQVLKRMSELNEAEGVSAREGATQIGSQHADQKSLDKLVPQLDAVTAFEKTASQVGDQLVKIAKKVDATGVPVIDRWVRAGRQAVAGDPDVTEFNSRLQTYTTESARILNNPNLTGPTTDSARHEMQDVMPKSSTAEQIERGVSVMKQESGWRKKNLQDQIDEVNRRRKQGAKKQPGEDFPSVSKDEQSKADHGREEILQQEMSTAKSRVSAAKTPEDKHRAEEDVKALERELGGAKKSTKKNAPLKNSRGWALHQDAQGNRAYVGPNGEIEEVK